MAGRPVFPSRFGVLEPLLASIGYHGFLTTMVGDVVKVKTRLLRARFLKLTRRVARSQEELLLRKIARRRATAFGLDHRFDEISSIGQFQRNVPISTYDYFEPYIRRVIEGDTQALIAPDDRLLMFALTSGTTATPKYIPVTQEFLDEYRKGWLVWASFILHDHPTAFEYSIVQAVSSAHEQTTGLGVPCGAISGLIAEMQPPVVHRMYGVPHEAAEISDAESKYYSIVRLALAGKVSFFVTANPSTVMACAKTAEKHAGELIRDIADGTLWEGCRLEGRIRQAICRRLRPDLKRARRLEALAAGGTFRLGEALDDLILIANWKGGTLKRYLDLYPLYFPGIPVRDIGLIASEGRMSIPTGDEGSFGVLDVASHFFEFIPCEENLRANPIVLLAHELEIGREYFIVLTTSSGLYRYNIYDVVRVTGFYNEAPVIEFRNKGSHFSSLTGEKLAEAQVVEAIGRVNAELSITLNTFTLCPFWEEGKPGYQLLIEEGSAAPSTFLKIAEKLDEELCRINVEYSSKRRTNRLWGIRSRAIPVGCFDEFRRKMVAQRGGRLEQFKHVFLTQDEEFPTKLGFPVQGR